jgi:glycosyltransferase involved in cell wall biosynthesis
MQLFEQATVFVMPSLYEPFGIVYVEAGTAGVPSIGTTVGGATDAIGPGGLLVDPGDDGGLLNAMRRLTDPTTAHSLGVRACEHASTYSWEAVARRVAAALLPTMQ